MWPFPLGVYGHLPCVRIHKDAELLKTMYKKQRYLLLQCGRIHKDAEIYVLILGE